MDGDGDVGKKRTHANTVGGSIAYDRLIDLIGFQHEPKHVHNCSYRFILCRYANVLYILSKRFISQTTIHCSRHFKTEPVQLSDCVVSLIEWDTRWYKHLWNYLKLSELYTVLNCLFPLSKRTVTTCHNAHWEPRNGLQQLRQSTVKIRFPEVEHTSALNRQTPPVFNLGILRYLVTVAWRNMNLSCAVSEAKMDHRILAAQTRPKNWRDKADLCCTVLHPGGIGTVEVSNRSHGGNNLVLALLTEILYYCIKIY